MKKATFRVREIRTFEFDMYFDEYLSLANMEKAAEKKWSDGPNFWQQARETEPANVLVGIKRDEYGDVAIRRIAKARRRTLNYSGRMAVTARQAVTCVILILPSVTSV